MRFVRCRIALLSILCILISPFAIAEELLVAKVYRDYPGYIASPTCKNPRLSPETVKQLAVKEQTTEMLTIEESSPGQRARKAYRDYPGYVAPPVQTYLPEDLALQEQDAEVLSSEEQTVVEAKEERAEAERVVAEKLEVENYAEAHLKEARQAVETAEAERRQAQRIADLKAVIESLTADELQVGAQSQPPVVETFEETDEVVSVPAEDSQSIEAVSLNSPGEEPAIATELKGVKVSQGQVVFEADGLIEKFRYFSLSNPPRLVVDLYNLEHSIENRIIDVDGDFSAIRIGNHEDKIRLVLDASGQELPENIVVNRSTEIVVTWNEQIGVTPLDDPDIGQMKEEQERLFEEEIAAEPEAKRLEDERLAAEEVARAKAEDEDELEVSEPVATLEAEQLAVHEAEQEHIVAEGQTVEKVEQERLAEERAVAELLASQKTEEKRLAAAKLAEAELAAQEAEQERLAAELAVAEKVAAERQAEEVVVQFKAAEVRQARQDAATDRYLVADEETATVLAANMASPTEASSPADTDTFKASPFYGGLWGGALFVDSTDADNTSFSAEVEYDDGYAFGLLLGYDFGAWRMDVEGAYRAASVDKVSVVGLPAATSGGDLEVLSFMVNGYYDFEMQGDLSPYVGAGIGFAEVSAENITYGGGSVVDDSDTVFAGQLSAGVLYELNNKVDLDLGYRFTMADDAELSALGGELEVEAGTHVILVGVKFHF